MDTKQSIAEGKQNPFWALEALGEHVNVLWGLLAETGVSVWDVDELGRHTRPRGNVGTMTYHLRAVDEYEQDLLNMLAALLPDVRAASEGDTAAMERVRQVLVL